MGVEAVTGIGLFLQFCRAVVESMMSSVLKSESLLQATVPQTVNVYSS